MLESTFSNLATDTLVCLEDKQTPRSSGAGRRPKGLKYPPDGDIQLWLNHNAPLTFDQLADIRYTLYHRCSRANFTIWKKSDDHFTITGRHSTLRIISNKARQCLLWQLRILGRQVGWIGALPRTKKPRKAKDMYWTLIGPGTVPRPSSSTF